MIAYCEEKKIPVQASAKKPYSMDRNLLHISFEAGILEDPWYDASAEKAREMYVISVSPEARRTRRNTWSCTSKRGSARRWDTTRSTPCSGAFPANGATFTAEGAAKLSPLGVIAC